MGTAPAFGAPAALTAATPPAVTTVIQRWNPVPLEGGGVVFELYGTKLNMVKSVGLSTALGVSLDAPTVLTKTKDLIVLRLASGLMPAEYKFTLKVSNKLTIEQPFKLRGSGLALGTDAEAADDSIAAGTGSTATGSSSCALGLNALASGNSSVSIGQDSTATGFQSFAVAGGHATGSFAFAIGGSALGFGSLAKGPFCEAEGKESTALGGLFLNSRAFRSTALGQYNAVDSGWDPENWVATDPILQVGNGADPASRSDCFTLLKNGNLTIAGTLTENSDARLKDHVEPLTEIVSKLRQVPAVTFDFKTTDRRPSGKQIGLLAQDVQAVFPELVTKDSNGTLSVAYGRLAAVLVGAVREQQQTIDAQAAQIRAMQARLEALEQREK
ncbi:MAG: tail fiber domain-containing protein [Planctomycetes bacterium]|nr:tail fiber domain-containing protein [Planctomycetota bacterium]